MLVSEGLTVADDLRDARREVAMLHLQVARMDDERKEQLSNLESHMQRKQSLAERSHQEQVNLLQEDLQAVRNERTRMILDLQAKLANVEKRYAEKDAELRKAKLEIFRLRVERDEAQLHVKDARIDRESSSTKYEVNPGEVPRESQTVDSAEGKNPVGFEWRPHSSLSGKIWYLEEESMHSNPSPSTRLITSTLVSVNTLVVSRTRNSGTDLRELSGDIIQ